MLTQWSVGAPYVLWAVSAPHQRPDEARPCSDPYELALRYQALLGAAPAPPSVS